MSSVVDDAPLADGASGDVSADWAHHPRHHIVLVSLIAALALLAAAGGLMWRKQQTERAALDEAMATGRATTAQAVAALDAVAAAVPDRVGAIAEALRSGTLAPQDVQPRLIEALGADAAISGYGVALDGDALPGVELFAPYVEQAAGRGEPPLETNLGDLYDYTDFKYAWYRNALLDGAGWAETNIFPDIGDQVALYAVPFELPVTDTGGGASGVVFATITFEKLAELLGSREGASGYSFVISREGRYMAHPREELVHDGAAVFTTAWEAGNTPLHRLAVDVIGGATSSIETRDAVTGRVNWTFAQPVPSTGWSVFTVLFGDQFTPDTDWERRETFAMIATGLAGAWLLLFAGIAYRVTWPETFHWAWAVSLTVALTIGVAALWTAADRYPPAIPDERTVVLDAASAHQFLEDTEAGATASEVPTGVFIRSVGIESGAEVMVSGFVWQRFEIGRQDGIPRGFMLPETFDPERSYINEIFKQQVGGEEFIGWEFKAAFRQRFDYGTFPFDRQSVWVRMRPDSLASNVVFVPDFGSYEMMNPSFRPGVDSALIVPGWDVIGSYFDYRMHAFNASLGLPGREGQANYPELYFNVELRRRFLGPFVTHIVPGAVTAAMLFALLLISSRREASEGLLGFSAAEIVLGAAALFFVASFQHSALRDSLLADTLIYFEYFYFGLYLLIMLVSINAILFASALHVRLIEYHDNLIPKLAFWPACMAASFVLTFARFY